MKQILKDLRHAVLYQHKSLTKMVDSCHADKIILVQNRINVRNILVHIKRLEDRFIFKKDKVVSSDSQILQDILTTQLYLHTNS